MFDFVSVLCATIVSLLRLILVLLNVLDKFRCSVTKKYFLIILNVPRIFLIVAFLSHKYSNFTLKSFVRQIYSGYENIDLVSYAERSITCIDRRIVVVRYAMKEKEVRDLFESCFNQVSDWCLCWYEVVSILLKLLLSVASELQIWYNVWADGLGLFDLRPRRSPVFVDFSDLFYFSMSIKRNICISTKNSLKYTFQ